MFLYPAVGCYTEKHGLRSFAPQLCLWRRKTREPLLFVRSLPAETATFFSPRAAHDTLQPGAPGMRRGIVNTCVEAKGVWL